LEKEVSHLHPRRSLLTKLFFSISIPFFMFLVNCGDAMAAVKVFSPMWCANGIMETQDGKYRIRCYIDFDFLERNALSNRELEALYSARFQGFLDKVDGLPYEGTVSSQNLKRMVFEFLEQEILPIAKGFRVSKIEFRVLGPNYNFASEGQSFSGESPKLYWYLPFSFPELALSVTVLTKSAVGILLLSFSIPVLFVLSLYFVRFLSEVSYSIIAPYDLQNGIFINSWIVYMIPILLFAVFLLAKTFINQRLLMIASKDGSEVSFKTVLATSVVGSLIGLFLMGYFLFEYSTLLRNLSLLRILQNSSKVLNKMVPNQ